MNILVVDDSAMMRGVVKQCINDNVDDEVNFFEAGNGEEALNTLNSNEINLVFLDWNMPVLDGLGFVKQVRGDGKDTPIIMVTSVTDQDKILEAGNAGVSGYVEKPIRGQDLWEQIKEFLE